MALRIRHGIRYCGAGCGQSTTAPDLAATATDVSAIASEVEDVPAEIDNTATVIELTPDNTSIEFVGLHKGDDPRPRHCRFEQFNGAAVIDGTLKSVTVEIETASLIAEIEKLTNHLKNADFFDVNQFPSATFESTEIKDQGNGSVEITGELTLLDNTHSLTFPATVDTDQGLKFQAEFEIDRTQWGMNYGPDQIEKQVPITITIGG